MIDTQFAGVTPEETPIVEETVDNGQPIDNVGNPDAVETATESPVVDPVVDESDLPPGAEPYTGEMATYHVLKEIITLDQDGKESGSLAVDSIHVLPKEIGDIYVEHGSAELVTTDPVKTPDPAPLA